MIVDPQCRLSFDQTSHCCTVITFHKPQTKKNLSLLYANSKKCKFWTFLEQYQFQESGRSGLIGEKRSGEPSEVLGKSDRMRILQLPPIFDYAAGCIFQYFNFPFPALFVWRLKANCQLDDLDWIWEPVEAVACNSENNLLPPDPPLLFDQPTRRASLEIANFIFRHEIQLRGTHSENLSDYWSNCDDNNIGSYFPEENAGGGLGGAKATWMREQDRIWILTFYIHYLQLLSPTFWC